MAERITSAIYLIPKNKCMDSPFLGAVHFFLARQGCSFANQQHEENKILPMIFPMIFPMMGYRMELFFVFLIVASFCVTDRKTAVKRGELSKM